MLNQINLYIHFSIEFNRFTVFAYIREKHTLCFFHSIKNAVFYFNFNKKLIYYIFSFILHELFYLSVVLFGPSQQKFSGLGLKSSFSQILRPSFAGI